MALFLFEATDAQGGVHKDKIEAMDRHEALILLAKKQLTPYFLEEEGKIKGGLNLNSGLFERIKPIDRITLVRNLAVTIKAGLNIIEAVQILIVDTNKKILKNILLDAKSSLERGQPLSATFAKYNKYFSPVFSGLIEAGEASGHLDKALEQLGNQVDKEYKLVRKVRSALAYPAILLVASIIVILILLVFVLPRLSRSFELSGAELPGITRAILAVSNAVRNNIIMDLVIVGSIFALTSYFRKSPRGRQIFLNFAMKIPVLSELIKKVALVRFTRNLSTLIGSGINIIDALQLSSQTTGNDLYKHRIVASIAEIKNGIALSDTLKNETKLFPHLLVNMIAVGEKTGTLEYVLKTFSDFYDEEVDASLKDLTTYLEPIMLLFMGVVIGTIALSVLLPIYQLVGKFT